MRAFSTKKRLRCAPVAQESKERADPGLMAPNSTPMQDLNGEPTAAPPPPPARGSEIALTLTLDEARVLRTIAQRGMLAAGNDGAPDGQPQQAKAAVDKLAAALDNAEVVEFVRDELQDAGLDTSRLSDAQVTSLARRLAERPHKSQ
jgi:hypothetical protein